MFNISAFIALIFRNFCMLCWITMTSSFLSLLRLCVLTSVSITMIKVTCVFVAVSSKQKYKSLSWKVLTILCDCAPYCNRNMCSFQALSYYQRVYFLSIINTYYICVLCCIFRYVVVLFVIVLCLCPNHFAGLFSRVVAADVTNEKCVHRGNPK